MLKINLEDKFNLINEYWSQKIVGELNDSHIKLAKLKGEFVWHKHEHEDELLCIIKGKLLVKFRDKDVFLEAGECLVIPKGVEHLPVAEEEVHVMFVEPKTTMNTGNVSNDWTKAHLGYN